MLEEGGEPSTLFRQPRVRHYAETGLGERAPISTHRLTLHNPVGDGRPCTHVACIDPPYPPAESGRRWATVRDGWSTREKATGQDAMIVSPEKVVETLLDIANELA